MYSLHPPVVPPPMGQLSTQKVTGRQAVCMTSSQGPSHAPQKPDLEIEDSHVEALTLSCSEPVSHRQSSKYCRSYYISPGGALSRCCRLCPPQGLRSRSRWIY